MARRNRPQDGLDLGAPGGDQPTDADDVIAHDDDTAASPVDVEAVTAPAPAAPSPTDAPAPLRFAALVRIHAGDVTYAPGDAIPDNVAADGLTEGAHYCRV